jgi:hypothetical protein
MKHFLDWYAELIERLPLPQRSGVKGIILMLSLAWFIFVPLPTGNEGGLVDNVLCAIMPWKCIDNGEGEKRWEAFRAHQAGVSQRPWHWVRNVYIFSAGAGFANNKELCTCHLDIRRPDGTIEHITYDTSATCDSVEGRTYRDGQRYTDWRINEPGRVELWNSQWDGRTACGAIHGIKKFVVVPSGGAFRFHCTSDGRYAIPGVSIEARR